MPSDNTYPPSVEIAVTCRTYSSETGWGTRKVVATWSLDEVTERLAEDLEARGIGASAAARMTMAAEMVGLMLRFSPPAQPPTVSLSSFLGLVPGAS